MNFDGLAKSRNQFFKRVFRKKRLPYFQYSWISLYVEGGSDSFKILDSDLPREFASASNKL